MKKINIEDANFSLPKWPQCIITGDPVTLEQVYDILKRTDLFVSRFTHKHCHGNDRGWIRRCYDCAGLPEAYLEPSGPEAIYRIEAVQNAINREFGVLNLEYLYNNWFASAYIAGPHGWCNPNGTILALHNVGKWPEVREIYDELKEIVRAFPYLNVATTLFNAEQHDDNRRAILSVVHPKNGEISVYVHDRTDDPSEWTRLHPVAPTSLSEDFDRIFARRLEVDFYEHEHGVHGEILGRLIEELRKVIASVK